MKNHTRYIGLAGALLALVAMGGCGSATTAGAPASSAVASKAPTTGGASAQPTGVTTPGAGTSGKSAPTPTGKPDLGGFYKDLAERNFTAEGYLGPMDRGDGKVAVVWKNPTAERRADVERMAASRGLTVEFLNAMMSAAELQALADRFAAAKSDLLTTYGWEYGGINGMSEVSPTIPRIVGRQNTAISPEQAKARDAEIVRIAGAELPVDAGPWMYPAGGSASPSPTPSR